MLGKIHGVHKKHLQLLILREFQCWVIHRVHKKHLQMLILREFQMLGNTWSPQKESTTADPWGISMLGNR